LEGTAVAAGEGPLAPPDEADLPGATEVLRVWWAGEHYHVTLRAQVIEDPPTWGGILADLVLGLEVAFAQTAVRDMAKTRNRILRGFRARLRQHDQEDEES
jgi:Domain of unknown function (DUF5076)